MGTIFNCHRQKNSQLGGKTCSINWCPPLKLESLGTVVWLLLGNIHLSPVFLHFSSHTYPSVLLSWALIGMMLQSPVWYLKNQLLCLCVLPGHVSRDLILRYKFWCKIGICSWNLFLKLPLMLSNPLPVVVLHHFEAYQSLLCPKQHQNHLQLVHISQRNLCFLKNDPRWLGPHAKF